MDKEVKVICDENGKQTGIVGNVDINGTSIFVDTRSGAGYKEILDSMGGIIKKFCKKVNFSDFSDEDVSQHISMYAIEAVPKYDPRKSVKLSTFIYMYIKNMLVNDFVHNSRFRKNATTLRLSPYRIKCKCGYTNEVKIEHDTDLKKIDLKCKNCMAELRDAESFHRSSRQEVLLFENNALSESIDSDFGSSFDQGVFDDYMGKRFKTVEDIDKDIDIKCIIDGCPEDIKRALRMICFDGVSILAASKEVNISPSLLYLRIKNLSKESNVKKLFDQVKQ